MRAIRCAWLALLAVLLSSGFVSAAEIYSATVNLSPTYVGVAARWCLTTDMAALTGSCL